MKCKCKCECCGREFEGRDSRAKFCCLECRYEMGKKYAREYKQKRRLQDPNYGKRLNDISKVGQKRRRTRIYAGIAHQIYDMVIEAQDREEVEAKIAEIVRAINNTKSAKLVWEELLSESNK